MWVIAVALQTLLYLNTQHFVEHVFYIIIEHNKFI